jgi:hypothetical protein
MTMNNISQTVVVQQLFVAFALVLGTGIVMLPVVSHLF